MRDRSSHAIHSLFGVVAVNGILLLLPGTAYGASAPSPPSDGAAFMPHMVAAIAANLDCALVETAAIAQQPPEEQGGSGCTNQDGTPRECTASEEVGQCAENARDAYEQCKKEAKGFAGRLACRVGLGIDALACIAEGALETILPFKKVIG